MADQHQGARLRHGGNVAGSRRSERLIVVGQHDGQVVDVHRAVPGELALRPRHAGLAIMRQHNREIVDIDLAVQVGVAGQRRARAGSPRLAGRADWSHSQRCRRCCRWRWPPRATSPRGCAGKHRVHVLHAVVAPEAIDEGVLGAVLVVAVPTTTPLSLMPSAVGAGNNTVLRREHRGFPA